MKRVRVRYAPSPTGFQHIGGVFAALINERLASQSEGVFYLRIERLFYRSVIHFSARGIE